MSDIYSANNSVSQTDIIDCELGQTIYLYVKTHNKTGLKYLGKTVSADPHKYKGSGKLWRSHCKVHGYDYTTVVLFQSACKDEIKQQGIYYSQLWDVVASDSWANLKQEECDGGYCPASVTPEANAKRSQTMRGRSQNPAHTAKAALARKGRKSKQSKEVRAQAAIKASAKLKGRKKPEGHGEKIRQRLIGRTLSNDVKNNLKAAWTTSRKLEQRARAIQLNAIVVSCPHCGKQGSKPSMQRNHFDNCYISTGNYKYLVTDPCGNTHKVWSLKDFCNDHGINFNSLSSAIKRGHLSFKGWFVQRRLQCDGNDS